LNSEIPYEKIFTPEYIKVFVAWLKNDLATTTKKWKVVYLHRPLYCSMPDDYHCVSSSKKMRNLYEDIFYHAKVDIVLTGHVHAYERLYPVYNGEGDMESVINDRNTYQNPKYPTHIVCGSGGNREGSEKYKPDSKISHIEFRDAGICQLEFTENRMEFKFIESNQGQTLDKFEIIKN